MTAYPVARRPNPFYRVRHWRRRRNLSERERLIYDAVRRFERVNGFRLDDWTRGAVALLMNVEGLSACDAYSRFLIFEDYDDGPPINTETEKW